MRPLGRMTSCAAAALAQRLVQIQRDNDFDFGDMAKMAPIAKMYTLGHDFVPPGIHAGGLRYHGMSPTVSQLVSEGLMEAKAVTQLDAYKAGVLFARTEGIIPAPESNHAIAQVVEEANKAKEAGEEKVILFNLSGHGLLDLSSYEKYFSNELDNFSLTDEELEQSESVFKDFPKPELLKSI